MTELSDLATRLMERAKQPDFDALFSQSSDHDGTSLNYLYDGSDVITVPEARRAKPRREHHWLSRETKVPRLAATHVPLTDGFVVASFVVEEVRSETEIIVSLYDIFEMCDGRTQYLFDSRGVPCRLTCDYANGSVTGDMRAFITSADELTCDMTEVVDLVMSLMVNERR